MLTCSSLGPMQDCMMGFFLVVTAFTLITGMAGWAPPVYPGNSGIAFPESELTSSRIRAFGISSPSITYSAFAIHFSSMVRQDVSSTASPRIPPAAPSSLYPSGVVGGSKHDAISIAGSTPMEMEIGSGFPAASAFSLNTPRWRAPGTKYMEISSLLWRQSLWIVMSDSFVSGSDA